ncbi:MAG TPA: hypothetical protein VN645_15830 [Steroidobacteraceae bacterium]|nr:hypothetical protein [Steroidobacteraceae bacterium]
MHENPNPEVGSPARGPGGAVRAVASVCIMLLALLGVLVVTEVIPRSTFTDVGGKLLAVGGIVLVAALAVGLISRR